MSNIVTFEQAEKLKYLGFRRECLHYYNYNSEEEIEEAYFFDGEERVFVHDLYDDFNDSNHTCSAPTVSEALDYLREEKGIYCSVNLKVKGYTKISFDTKLRTNIRYYYYVFNDISRGSICSESKDKFNTHPLASSALLTAVLDYLEKKQTI